MTLRKPKLFPYAGDDRRLNAHTTTSKEVDIRGVTYPSLMAAARALGVSRASIAYAMENGKLDTCGLPSAPKKK
jgi:hypothetical protein